MKYKIVGVIDIFLGSIFSIIQIILLSIVYPRMLSLYEGFGSVLPLMTRYFLIYSFFLLLIFLGTLYAGIKLVKKPTRNLFLAGVVGLLIMLIFGGYFIGVSFLSLVIPLYSFTGSL